MPAAQAMYKRSVEIRPSASGLFNLGVTYYHGSKFLGSNSHSYDYVRMESLDLASSFSIVRRVLIFRFHVEDYPAAIQAWNESVELEPSSPDTHTSTIRVHLILPLIQLIGFVRSGKRIYYVDNPPARFISQASQVGHGWPTVQVGGNWLTDDFHQNRILIIPRRPGNLFQSRGGVGSV